MTIVRFSWKSFPNSKMKGENCVPKFLRCSVTGEHLMRFESEKPTSTFSFIQIVHVNMRLNRSIRIRRERVAFYKKCRILGNVSFLSNADFLLLLALRYLTDHFHWKSPIICIPLNCHSIMRLKKHSKCSFHYDRPRLLCLQVAIRDKRIEQLEAEFTDTQQQYTECYDEVISPRLLIIVGLTSLLTSITCMSVCKRCIPCLGLFFFYRHCL